MTSTTNGFMTGDPVGGRWSLWKATNGGANWDSTGLYLAQVGTETGYNNSMICTPPYIWFGTNNSKIYYSSNNGTTWVTQVTTGEVNSYAIWFHPLLQSGVGLFGGTNLYQTTNNGINWITLTSMGSGNFGGITSTPLLNVVDNLVQPVWYVRSTNLIYYSANFGANWGIDYTNPTTTSYYRHISMAYPGRGIWAVGTLGKITYHTALVNIENIGLETPGNYSLYQNYPNPFNPVTKIKFDIKKSVFRSQNDPKGTPVVSSKIFDITGREVVELVNEQLQPGTYEVTFDGSNMASGIYFYTLQSGNAIITKKLMVIK
ncbi:MAG TPA: T9SS type A sorting domain-containing protein [Ignavibacteria bacterium]